MLLARFSISLKLFILSTLPLLLLTLLLLNEGIELYNEKNDSYQTEIVVGLTKKLDRISHHYALERGLTVGLLELSNLKIKNELFKQRIKSDNSVIALKQFIYTNKIYLTPINTRINSLLDVINKKQDIRGLVDRRTKNNDAFNYYSLINKKSINAIERLTIFVDNHELHKELNSLVALLWLKERSAQIRGALNGVYTRGSVTTEGYSEIYRFITDFNNNFDLLANNRKFYAKTLLIETAKTPNFLRTDTIHNNFLRQSKTLDNIVGPSSSQWFSLYTQRVSALHNIIDIQTAYIYDGAHQTFVKSKIYLILGSVVMLLAISALITLSYKISLNISTRILNIDRLLTRSINENDLSIKLNVDGADEITHIAKGINNYIGWMDDVVSDVKKTSLENEHLANHDPLTKLANRSLFLKRLTSLTNERQHTDNHHAILYIDLDFFKNINDVHGHLVGDKVLKEFSDILAISVRDTDTTARLGGDEFAVILHNITTSQTQRVAQKIIHNITAPLTIDDLTLHLSISIGITFFTAKELKDSTTLLKEADQALYRAKKSGRNRYQYFDETLRKSHKENKQLEVDLDQALKNQQIRPHFQPQYCLKTHEIIGLEAFARWRHPIKGFISPTVFVPLAQRRSVITKLTESMMRQTYAHLGAFIDIQPKLKVAFNVSSSECSSPGLLHLIQRLLKKYQLKPEQIELEIGESVLVERQEASADNLAALHRLGVSIAIDDFGTGYASLNDLTTLPIDTLKIDMSFVQRIGVNRQQETIIKVIIDLAKRLSLKVIAKGIETQAQADFLTSHGCDYGQGYFYSKPCSAEDIHKILEKNRTACMKIKTLA